MDYFDDYYDVEEFSSGDVRDDLRRVVDYFRSMDYHEHAMNLFIVDYRNLPYSVSDDAEAFAVDEEIPIEDIPEWMKYESLGFVRKNFVPMWGRCVFPVKAVDGSIIGLCGWDPTNEPKYLDSKCWGYKAKQTTLYGMEKLEEYYNSKDMVYVTEGLMCCLYLRSKGFQALATLGSYTTPYVTSILKRFGTRLVMVPDNDETGSRYAKSMKYKTPKAIIVQPAYGKDIDGLRRYEDGKYEEELLQELKSLTNPFVMTKLLIRS